MSIPNNQCWFNAGPLSATLARHWNNVPLWQAAFYYINEWAFNRHVHHCTGIGPHSGCIKSRIHPDSLHCRDWQKRKIYPGIWIPKNHCAKADYNWMRNSGHKIILIIWKRMLLWDFLVPSRSRRFERNKKCFFPIHVWNSVLWGASVTER